MRHTFLGKAKQEQIVQANVPEDLIAGENIFFLPGRLNIRKLSWKDRLILKFGAMAEKDKNKKAAMSHDMDAVKKDNLTGIINAVWDLAATTTVR